MEAKISDHVWTLEEIVGLVEARELERHAERRSTPVSMKTRSK
jgi:hypothetical protein